MDDLFPTSQEPWGDWWVSEAHYIYSNSKRNIEQLLDVIFHHVSGTLPLTFFWGGVAVQFVCSVVSTHFFLTASVGVSYHAEGANGSMDRLACSKPEGAAYVMDEVQETKGFSMWSHRGFFGAIHQNHSETM